MEKTFTAESVTPGHPDKICDQISDAVLDAALSDDSDSRVAVETIVKSGMVMVFGEMNTKTWVDIEKIARKTIYKIGYNKPELGFDSETCAIISTIGQQSPEIAAGVTKKEISAGDQGIMVGFACQETENFLPLPIFLAKKLTESLVQKRKILPFLRPDGKSQVSIQYKNGKPKRVESVLISLQHDPKISQQEITTKIKKEIVFPNLENFLDKNTEILINPSGSFVIGGPVADSGLTGRKIIVDNYGPICPHGGGAFSGKDATKVDRSGALVARHIAKNLVAAGIADKCQISISFSIGIAKPISIEIETFGTEKISHQEIKKLILENWDLRVGKIIERFNLKKPIFHSTAAFGPFFKNNFPWEKIDMIENLTK